jgi:hypothetical protein
VRRGRRIGLAGRQQPIVEAAADSAIVPRPAGVYPIEIYTDERIEELEAQGRMTPEEETRVEQALARPRRR